MIMAQSDTFMGKFYGAQVQSIFGIQFCIFFVVCLVLKILLSFKHYSLKGGGVY